MDQDVVVEQKFSLNVSWPQRTSLTMATYSLRGLPCFVIMNFVPIYGMLSALDNESLAFNIDKCKKGMAINWDEIHTAVRQTNGSVYISWYQDKNIIPGG